LLVLLTNFGVINLPKFKSLTLFFNISESYAASANIILFWLNILLCFLFKISNWLFKILESWIDPVVVITEIGILKSSEIIDIFVTLYWLNEIFSIPNLLHIKVVSEYKKLLFFSIKVKYLFNNLS